MLAGFLAMSGVALASFLAASALLGTERILVPGSFEASSLWNAVTIVLGFAAAIAGGLACGWVTRRAAATYTLVGVAALFGVAFAAMNPNLAWQDRGAGFVPTSFEAQFAARIPAWLLFSYPALDTIGILLGAALARRTRDRSTPPAPSPIDSAPRCPEADDHRPEANSPSVEAE